MDGFWPTFMRRKPTPPRLVEGLTGKPAQEFFNPRTVIIPLQETVQAVFGCSVKARDEVKAGQKICEKGTPPYALAVHASISGTIREIDSFSHPNGCYGTGVLIEADGREEPCQKISAPTGSEANMDTLLQAGIPLEYETLAEGKVKTLVVNGTEFEPYLNVKHQIIEEQAAEVIGGLRALMRIFSVSKAAVAVERKQRKAIQALEKGIADSQDITVVATLKSYPPTAERVVIGEILKKGNGKTEGKVLPVDLAFLPAVYEAVQNGMPFVERMITVAGSGVPDPRNLKVRIGTTFDEIIVHCGANPEGVTQIVMGGALMGISQPTGQVPVTQTTPGILALVTIGLTHGRQSRMYEEGPCVRCAKCVDVCPVSIVPTTIAAYCRKRRFEAAEESGLFVCVDCGLCSYVCPARIPLAQILKEARSRNALRAPANRSSGNNEECQTA